MAMPRRTSDRFFERALSGAVFVRPGYFSFFDLD
jgi:hypothetical protein